MMDRGIFMHQYEMNTYYFATVTNGLETVLGAEIEERGIARRDMKYERGKVVFKALEETNRLKTLRCADNIYCIVAEFTVGAYKSDLAHMASNMKKLNWNRLAVEFSKSSRDIRVSTSRRGKHTYSRFDMKETIEDVLEKDGFVMSQDDHALCVRADIEEAFCRVSIKLTEAHFRFRGDTRIYSRGSIRPTVAAALVRISKPCKDDVFYDPFCGAGTIPDERAQLPARRILASDIEEEVVLKAKENGKGGTIVFRCDARKTPSQSESIDRIVSNLPWNKQIAVENVRKLYMEFLAEANRILKPNGWIVLLTDCHEEITKASEENGLCLSALYELSLHGLHPKVYKLRKVNIQ
ncbi:methyltransferase domain-containing protein [Paenibacillaceae bacterium]|nr:methyltransferase domain-containing protein [Paenibacillaceae bacterium]